ncbi:MAG TPA: Crp/Fnr family transcriptional regulator [Nitrospiraceae bacterium]|nr:Crp/Fnr family transcriptional regulator [Nitrospiraceae bacterium]
MTQENLDPSENLILAALSPAELRQVLSQAKPVILKDKEVIYEQESRVDAVYFPLTGAVSMLTHMGDGNAVEAAVVGKQGFVGFPVLFSGERSFAEAVVQVPGHALKLSAAAFRDNAGPLLNRLLLRYAHFFFKEVFVSNGCNRFHTVEQRISRWLLAHRVRTYKNVFPFTHEFLAYLLGAQRSTVTETTGELQKQGLIRYGYGEMAIVNQAGLEAASCECFGRVRQELDLFSKYVEQQRRVA